MAFKGRPMAKAKPMPGKSVSTYRPPVAPISRPPVKAVVNNEDVARGNIAPKKTSIELEMSVLRILCRFPMGYSENYIPIISLEGKGHVVRKPRKYGAGFDYHVTQSGKDAWEKYAKNKGVAR